MSPWEPPGGDLVSADGAPRPDRPVAQPPQRPRRWGPGGLPGGAGIARGAVAGSILTAFAFQGVLVVSGVLVARLLGVEDRGHLALLVLIPTVLTQLGGLGLPLAATFEIARAPRMARAVMRSLVRPAVVQGLALTALHAAILGVLLPGRPEAVQVAGVLSLGLVPGLLAFEYGQAVLQGEQRFRAFNVLRLMPQGLYSAAVLVLFVAAVDELEIVVVAWVVPVTVLGALAVAVATRAPPPPEEDPAPPLRDMLRFGLRGLLGASSPSESLRVDQAVVGLFLTPASLGLYVVGLALTNLPRFVAQAVGTVAYPHVAAQTDPGAARRTMWRMFGLTVALCALIVGALELLAGRLVPFFFGESFADAVPLTRILLLSALLLSARRILIDAARGAGHVSLGNLGEAVSWGTLVPAMAVLAPTAGARGVAAALAISSACSLGAMLLRVGLSPPDGGRSLRSTPPRADAVAAEVP